ncbi:unnamed protein product, partial [Urochloa humidicola]
AAAAAAEPRRARALRSERDGVPEAVRHERIRARDLGFGAVRTRHAVRGRGAAARTGHRLVERGVALRTVRLRRGGCAVHRWPRDREGPGSCCVRGPATGRASNREGQQGKQAACGRKKKGVSRPNLWLGPKR